MSGGPDKTRRWLLFADHFYNRGRVFASYRGTFRSIEAAMAKADLFGAPSWFAELLRMDDDRVLVPSARARWDASKGHDRARWKWSYTTRHEAVEVDRDSTGETKSVFKRLSSMGPASLRTRRSGWECRVWVGVDWAGNDVDPTARGTGRTAEEAAEDALRMLREGGRHE